MNAPSRKNLSSENISPRWKTHIQDPQNRNLSKTVDQHFSAEMLEQREPERDSVGASRPPTGGMHNIKLRDNAAGRRRTWKAAGTVHRQLSAMRVRW
jgi:hypothetical protein